MLPDFLAYPAVTIFGLIIGSFINCVIYRLEKHEAVTGRSYCPHCKHQLAWHDLVPIASFFALRGACRYCRKRIAWQYPLVELLAGIIFLAIFIFFRPMGVGGWLQLLFFWYIASVFMVLFIYDLKHCLIPDAVLLPAIAIALIYRLTATPGAFFYNYLLAALAASGFFLLIFLLSGGRWMGFGDVKLAALLGLFMGFPGVVWGLFFACVFGAIIGIVAICLKKKRMKSEMPFAPFLIAGNVLALLWGKEIISWYMGLFLFV